MPTSLRIREASPSELLAERLEREALLAGPGLAEDYRRQAEMLREMTAIQKIAARNMFADNFLPNL